MIKYVILSLAICAAITTAVAGDRVNDYIQMRVCHISDFVWWRSDAPVKY